MKNALLLLILAAVSCQQTGKDWIDGSRHEGLNKLKVTEAFEVLSTETALEGIALTTKYLEEAKIYFDRVFNEDLNFALLFIDNQNWDKYAWAPPPGMPQTDNKGNIILGLGKSVMAKRWEQQLLTLAVSKRDSLKHGPDHKIDLDLFFREALSMHELGHLYQFYRSSENTQRRWLNELFGNLCQIAAARNLSTNQVFSHMDYFQRLLLKEDLWGPIQYRTLKQFEESYLDIIKQGRNYGWYQAHFYSIARELYLTGGDSFLRQFRDLLIETDVDKIGKLDDAELETILSEKLGARAVRLMSWEAGNFEDYLQTINQPLAGKTCTPDGSCLIENAGAYDLDVDCREIVINDIRKISWSRSYILYYQVKAGVGRWGWIMIGAGCDFMKSYGGYYDKEFKRDRLPELDKHLKVLYDNLLDIDQAINLMKGSNI